MLDFVGDRRKVPWLNASITNDPWFRDLCFRIQSERQGTSTQNMLYAIFAHAEHVLHLHGISRSLLEYGSFLEWKEALRDHSEQLACSVIQHGTQGNIPQRAGIVIDFLCRSGLWKKGEKTTTVELGCSAGLLGRVFVNAHALFAADDRWREFFWLARVPKVAENVPLEYVGMDRVIPPPSMVPYFMTNMEQRKMVEAFMVAYPYQAGELVVADVWEYLNQLGERVPQNGSVVFLTAFMLYHFEFPQPLVHKLLRIVSQHTKVHWLDLSRARVFMGTQCHDDTRVLQPQHVYLRHNGVPVAHVINGSDDCPDWEWEMV